MIKVQLAEEKLGESQDGWSIRKTGDVAIKIMMGIKCC